VLVIAFSAGLFRPSAASGYGSRTRRARALPRRTSSIDAPGSLLRPETFGRIGRAVGPTVGLDAAPGRPRDGHSAWLPMHSGTLVTRSGRRAARTLRPKVPRIRAALPLTPASAWPNLAVMRSDTRKWVR
jgi:hypothetical protein